MLDLINLTLSDYFPFIAGGNECLFLLLLYTLSKNPKELVRYRTFPLPGVACVQKVSNVAYL
jgi:hypothetical protein